MRKINCFLLFATLTFRWSVGENRLYHLDGVELFHRVSDKFLSISVDPAVLLAGVKLSDDSLKLVRNLSPAYIRLAGPSTRFVKYLDKKEQTFSFKDKYHNIYVTPSMWFGINEWFRLAKLSPVFAIYDANSSEGVWNPNSTLPLLEFSDKLDIQCYWQLGNDCDNKTLVEYVDKIHILRQTLNGFPDHINNWKIVGSDLSKCNFDETDSSSNGKLLDDLDITVTAITWQSYNVATARIPFIDKVDLGLTKADLWTSVPKETGPVTFDSAIQWAIEVGQAALLGNSVIFKELRLLELTHDTPSKNTLEAIRDNILKEAEVDKLYYDSNNENLHPKPSLVGKADGKPRALYKHLDKFIEQSKNHNIKSELKRNSKDHLHLSIGEIENILKQRARAKAAARNIRLTSAELDMLVEKATLKIPKYFVSKRDINRALLEENAQGYQNNMHNEHFNDDKQYEIKRMMRNINMPLLNLKSLQEEHKKYLFDTRKPQAQKAKRDINLDLVKQRTQVGSKRTLSLPKFMSQNYAQESKGVSKNAPVKVVDRTFEDSLAEQESFPDLSDSNDEETKHYFISKKANNAKVRKKRKTSTEAITKDKLKNLKTTTRNEIKKLKQQLKLEKTSYLRQKLKSKKHLASKSNIQKVPKHNVRQLIENAVSAENAIDHKQKRSLNANGISFGKYKSKVSELEDWKPADILGLKQEDIPSPVQGRKRSDFAETRQKRYIDDQLENVSDNKIFDDDQEWKHDREDRVKLFNYENAKWKKGTPRKLLKNWNTQRKELDTSNNNTEFDARVTSEDQIRRVETNQLNNLISKAAPDLYEDQEITTKIPYIESATTKHIMRSNLTYLERVLGKNKAIPIDMFFKNIKSAFEGVKDFVRNIV
ncbi:hypothetical protein D910_06424 [Dendroctonus ponderosae]|uniref:Uncharacterized protein n=1 Tax=Dendroctonus ponderosae TaxID=77166 RepID=U4UEK9_DENPD|nr:hypothetical protein D910_06424 [Dendroctonus ponderosae]